MSVLGSIIPGWKWISGTVGVLVIGFVLWWGIDTFFVGPRDLPKAQRDALKIAAADLEAQLMKRLDETDRYQLSLAILPVKGDTGGGEAEDVLVSLLEDNQRISIPNSGVMSDIKKSARDWLFGKDTTAPHRLLESRGELDGVLWLQLERENRAKVAGATLSGTLYEHAVDSAGKRTMGVEEISVAATGRIEIESGDVVTSDDGSTGGTFWSDAGRFILSVLLLLGIPFLWLPLTDWVRDATRRRNNNLIQSAYFLLVVATSVAPYAAFFLFRGTPEGAEPEPAGAFAWIVGVLMLGFAAKWTYDMHSAWSDRV